MKTNQKSKKIVGLVGLFICFYTIYWLLLQSMPMAFPSIGYGQSVAASWVATLLICGFAMSMAGQPGGSAAHDFFVKSARGNSRAVIVVSTTEDLREVMFRLKAAGLQPMRATV